MKIAPFWGLQQNCVLQNANQAYASNRWRGSFIHEGSPTEEGDCTQNGRSFLSFCFNCDMPARKHRGAAEEQHMLKWRLVQFPHEAKRAV